MTATPCPASARASSVWRAAFEEDFRLDIGESTGRIKQPANRITGVKEQQGMGRKGDDINRAIVAKLEFRRVGGQHVIGWQRDTIEPRVHALIVADADMNFAAL